MSLANLTNQDNGSWVNDPIQGTCHDTAQKNGKNGAFYVGSLTQDGFTVSLFSKHVDFTEFEGKVIDINGSGISKQHDDYNKCPKLLMGNKAIVKVIGGAAPTATQATPKGSDSAPKGGAPVVNGQTVGMAINNAIAIMQGDHEDLGDFLLSEEGTNRLAKIAGRLVMVSEQVQSGKLEGFSTLENNGLGTEPGEDEPPF